MNISIDFSYTAARLMDKKAVIMHKRVKAGYEYSHITFGELESLSNVYANSFHQLGIHSETKVLLFVKSSLKFHAIVFALIKIGAVPIFIDPAMGKKNLRKAISDVKPEAFIGEPLAHVLKLISKAAFKSIKISITTGKYKWGKAKRIQDLESSDDTFIPINLDPYRICAILFTSGGTGEPKGVIYSHRIFQTQIGILKKLFKLTDEDIDLPGFPMFSLFTLVMGMTSCIPDMSPSHPAEADPEKLVKNIQDLSATFISGSPAIWEPLVDYCLQNNIVLPKVKSLVMFGAPVTTDLHRKFKKVLTNGDTFTPYGATESLPVSCISGTEILQHTANLTDQGKGTCVGNAAPGIEIKIIKISEEPLSKIEDCNFLKTGEIGEIIVKGDVVTKRYFQNDTENLRSKIKDKDLFWHRIGDLGYLDEENRLWFCGRKIHRLATRHGMMCSVPTEAIFNQHKDVKRTALVGLGDKEIQEPAIVIELNKKSKSINRKELEKELNIIGAKFENSSRINKFYYSKKFPVDVRHNIKIDRLKLAQEAQEGKL